MQRAASSLRPPARTREPRLAAKRHSTIGLAAAATVAGAAVLSWSYWIWLVFGAS
ncbi:MAG: hypothetical protein ACFCVH_21200 [Alphaproteobacteria bacterium]